MGKEDKKDVLWNGERGQKGCGIRNGERERRWNKEWEWRTQKGGDKEWGKRIKEVE